MTADPRYLCGSLASW